MDLSDLIPEEGWPDGDGPSSLLYFFGPLPEDVPTPAFSDVGFPQRARDRIEKAAGEWLRSLHHLLPYASATASAGDSFDFELLHVPASKHGVRGDARLKFQHIKANIDPNERYVLSLPGSNKFRLSAWRSEVDNLVLCGDWIDTGLNVGSFEAAVTSGMLASHALTGSPPLDEISGYAFLRTPPSPAPRRASWPGPVEAP